MNNQKNIINKLNWDSEFWGIKIGKLLINDCPFDKSNYEFGKYNLVQVFTNYNLEKELNQKPIDVKVLFSKKLNEISYIKNKNIKSYTGSINNTLIKLSHLSGNYSRFKIDTLLNKKFEELYSLWIAKSLNRELAGGISMEEMLIPLVPPLAVN